jgi:cytidylate kinase
MRSIIISGMPSCGKSTVAAIVAKELGFKMVNGGDVLKEIAKENGYTVSGEDWWDTEQGMKFLKQRAGDPKFDKEVDRRMIEKLDRGDIVTTSYVMPWVYKDGFKVWLSATQKSRAQRMATRDHTTMEESIKAIKARDKRNIDLYYKQYGIRFGEDLKPFDIIIDTEAKAPEESASIILKKFNEANKK